MSGPITSPQRPCPSCHRMVEMLWASPHFRGGSVCSLCWLKLAKQIQPKPLNATPYGPAGVSSGQPRSREKDVRYMTGAEVKAYVASWLRYIGNQATSTPRYYQRLRHLPAPAPVENRVRGQDPQRSDPERT